MYWSDRDVYVTSSNPFPGRQIPLLNAFGGATGTRSDDGLGVNIYIAGGTGPGGTIPVTGNLGVQLDLSGASISLSPNVNITSSIPLDVVDTWGLRLTGSTTSATLGINGTYTGSWCDVLHYSSLFVVIKSNVTSSLNGLILQWSPDANQVICDYKTAYFEANQPQHLYVPNRGRYVRALYQNDGAVQSSFFLGILARKAHIPENFLEYEPGNTTTTPLAKDAIFTGQPVDLLGYSSVNWSISSDKPSATDGVLVQFSPDSVNWVTRFTADLRNDRTGPDQATDLTVRAHDRFFRLVYTNGNQAQSWFRLFTHLNKTQTMGDGIGVDQTVKSGMDAILTKALITGRTSAGGTTYVDVKVDPSGKLLTTVDGAVSVTNLPATQSVSVISSVPLQVNGNVGVSGTASVYIQGTSAPLNVTGAIGITNFPVVQQVTGTVTVQGISLSGSTPPESIPNSLENVVYTRKAQRFDLSSDTVNYIGYSAMGTSPLSASWTIKRLSFDASGSLEASEWSSPTAIWNNRSSEVYS